MTDEQLDIFALSIVPELLWRHRLESMPVIILSFNFDDRIVNYDIYTMEPWSEQSIKYKTVYTLQDEDVCRFIEPSEGVFVLNKSQSIDLGYDTVHRGRSRFDVQLNSLI